MTILILACIAVAVGGVSWAVRLNASLFRDVPDAHSYAEAISALRSLNIVSGYDDGSYRPDAPVNRAEFMQIVIRATGKADAAKQCVQNFRDQYGAEAQFLSDVPPGAWFEPALCYGVLSNIVAGYDDATFRPERVISVSEAAKILAGSFGLPVAQQQPGAAWYKRYAEALATARALPGGIGSFDQHVDRGLLAEMTYMLLEPLHTHATVTYDDVLSGKGILHGSADVNTSLSAVNAERAAAGLLPLRGNTLLDQAAAKHSTDMLQRGFFAHEDPEGRKAEDRIRATGYFDGARNFTYGETITRNATTVDEAVRAFMNSPLHKSILLSPDYDEMGAGRAGDYWTFVFAKAVR